jgi:hypothetical protein
MRKFLGLSLSLALLAALTASPAAASNVKQFYLGDDYGYWCDLSSLYSGDPLDVGFANINYTGNGKIEATARVKGLEPNSEYKVRLIQGNSDCFTVDAVFTTNGKGHGGIHVREDAVIGSPGVILIVDVFGFGAPAWGTERVDAPA